jgi:hypothetical protein
MEPAVFSQTLPYKTLSGIDKEITLPLVDIPAGTLLFRGIRLPDISKGDDSRSFIRDFLGDPVGDSFCLTPVHNVFFYPFPYIPFGAHTVGKKFNAINVYVTRKAMRIVCLISPSPMFRGGEIKTLDGTAPIQRCSQFRYECTPIVKEEDLDEKVATGAMSAEEAEAALEKRKQDTATEEERKREVKSWDNCIHPNYPDINGWMAIADYDALESLDQKALAVKDTTMSKYILELNTRRPGKLAEILSYMYSDKRRHRGIPEIVLHPWLKKNADTVMTDAASEEEVIEQIRALSDNFAFLPCASITSAGILDGINGDFQLTELPADSIKNADDAVRGAIEANLESFMKTLETTGLDIPDLGITKVRFDSRTGFYVLDRFAQRDTVKDAGPYSQLLFPLETAPQKSFASTYRVLFRTFFPDKLLKPEAIVQGMAPVRRAFIFERPSIFKKMFDNIGRADAFPAEHHTTVRNAAALFQRNSGTRNNGRGRGRGRGAPSSRGRGSFRGRGGSRRMVRPSETPIAMVETMFEHLSDSSQHFLNKTMKNVYGAFWSRSSR